MQEVVTAISVSQFQRNTGMNLFLSQMTFQGAGTGASARAVAVEADMWRINYNMGRLVQAPYRHSILVQGLLLLSAPPLDLKFKPACLQTT